MPAWKPCQVQRRWGRGELRDQPRTVRSRMTAQHASPGGLREGMGWGADGVGAEPRHPLLRRPESLRPPAP
ncbi:hypothetical protein GCM10010289_28490 [Streptomyces violascens]|uniref:Uncharacterized protein n=1 Tax=Streptomyces violascens TaxID=67381 RepID=A0ABQ3QUJ0_9ACTN|nr:hypothetical protein GCM10010289_28490 [Streptomyces violascens]GHI40949.1 hypothetical protein Sviol_53570 [Streptomyces violascens]